VLRDVLPRHPLQPPYCGAKHACKGFTESVLTELRRRRSQVRISMIQLPGLNTPPVHVGPDEAPKQTMPGPPIY
jgi:hypothetical protein